MNSESSQPLWKCQDCNSEFSDQPSSKHDGMWVIWICSNCGGSSVVMISDDEDIRADQKD